MAAKTIPAEFAAFAEAIRAELTRLESVLKDPGANGLTPSISSEAQASHRKLSAAMEALQS